MEDTAPSLKTKRDNGPASNLHLQLMTHHMIFTTPHDPSHDPHDLHDPSHDPHDPSHDLHDPSHDPLDPSHDRCSPSGSLWHGGNLAVLQLPLKPSRTLCRHCLTVVATGTDCGKILCGGYVHVHGCIHEACNCSSEELHVALAHLVYQFEITTVPSHSQKILVSVV